MKNMFDKDTFVELKTLRKKYEDRENSKEQEREKLLALQAEFQYSPLLLSVPFVNIIGVFYRHTREQMRIENGIILSLLLL